MTEKQILLFSTLENVPRAVWRICILMLWCKGLKEENSTSFFPTYLNNAGSIHYHPGNIPYMKPLCILFHYTELLRPTKKGFFSYPHMITANSIPQHSGTVGQQLLPVLNEPKGGGGMGW